MGPLVSEEQLDRVTGYLELRRRRGRATRSPAASRVGDQGYFVEPTVLTDTTPDDEGRPRGDLRPGGVRDPVQRPTRTRSTPATTPATASPPGVWTRDITKAHRIAHRLRAGTVWINCYNVFDAALPFGGYKQSGWGREMGHEALDNYTETKSVVTQLA